MKIFIGIDNSSIDHKVHIIDENGKSIISFIIPNEFHGFEELNRIICKYKEVYIGFELPHGPLIDYLRSKKYMLFSINPLKIKRFKESSIVSGNKNDKIDAESIAHYLLRYYKNIRPLSFNSRDIEKLKILMISHRRLKKEHTRFSNRLLFILKQYFPLYTSLFSNHSLKIQLKMILTYPKYQDLHEITEKELIDFLKSNNYRNPKYIDKVLKKINNYKQLISPEIEEALIFESQALAHHLLLLKNELIYIEIKMKEICEFHNLCKYFKSLPGSGELLSCKLLAIFGDNKNRFSNANSVQSLFGTAPRNHQSGPYHKVIMRRACNKLAREILYNYAFITLKTCNWAREYYDEQRKKGKRNSVAIRALSNKWVKIIYKIWKDEILYDENKKIKPAA